MFYPQLNYLELIPNIIDRIRTAKEPELSDHVDSVFKNSFTSTELLMSVTHELLSVVNENRNLRKIIGEDVKKLKDYCSAIGLQVR